LNVCDNLTKLRLMTDPEQVRVFCFELTQKQWLERYASANPPQVNIAFNMNKPMGRKSVGNLLHSFCKAAGLPDWEKKTNHCLRQFGITKLANDARVNATEVASAARHRSTISQQAYIRPTLASEVARNDVLAGARVAAVVAGGAVAVAAAADEHAALVDATVDAALFHAALAAAALFHAALAAAAGGGAAAAV
jgi:hypothetical protein